MFSQPSQASRPVVLVTGAARRIGREIALEMARHGHDVAVHCHRTVDDALPALAELRERGARAEAFTADLADETATRALVPAVLDRFGRLDAVVNNASVFEHDTADSFGYASMERHWRVNTGAPVMLAQALHRHVASRTGGGCVVNLLDQRLWNPNPDHLSYTLSKAALQAATTMLAMALAPAVRVCGIAPGVTLPSGPMSEGQFERAHRLTPLQRSSTPQDIARAVRFLVESPAITGTTLLVDGGQHLSAQPRDVRFLVEGRG
jgi:NAD(P)-dependent dehydrogenase (short-subunit alcohol dehydrogenase family)